MESLASEMDLSFFPLQSSIRNDSTCHRVKEKKTYRVLENRVLDDEANNTRD